MRRRGCRQLQGLGIRRGRRKSWFQKGIVLCLWHGAFVPRITGYNWRFGTRQGRSDMKSTDALKLYHVHGKHVVRGASHRGEELFLHLASQGIESQVHRTNGHAQLELDEDVNLPMVQAI